MKRQWVLGFCSFVLYASWCLAGHLSDITPSPANVGEMVTYTKGEDDTPFLVEPSVRVGNIDVAVANWDFKSITFTLPDGTEANSPKLLGGIYTVFIRNMNTFQPSFVPKVALKVWGVNLPGYSTQRMNSRPPVNMPSQETLLFQFCGGEIPQVKLDKELTEVTTNLNNIRGLYVKPIGRFRFPKPDDGGPIKLCNCTLAEHDFMITRMQMGEIVRQLAIQLPPKLPGTTLREISPLINYSAQWHYSSHPGPDHPLDLFRHPNPTWRSFTLKSTTNPETAGPQITQLSTPQGQTALGANQTLVAVLDTGFNPNLAGPIENKVLGQQNYDWQTSDIIYGGYNRFQDIFFVDSQTSPHGSPIARIIGQMAPLAQILPIKVCFNGGHTYDSTCSETNVVRGICYAANMAESEGKKLVLNLSLSNYNWSPILKDILDGAVSQGGAVVVAASGNANPPIGQGETAEDTNVAEAKRAYEQGAVTFPAGYGIDLPVLPKQQFGQPSPDVAKRVYGIKGIIGVGSVGIRKNAMPGQWEPTDKTIRGMHVTLAAPGRLILPNENEKQKSYSGTSFAAAFVSGYIAALRSQLGNDLNSPSGVVACMTLGTHLLPLPAPTNNEAVGKGVLKTDAQLSCP